jgi:hypothetical protein
VLVSLFSTPVKNQAIKIGYAGLKFFLLPLHGLGQKAVDYWKSTLYQSF